MKDRKFLFVAKGDIVMIKSNMAFDKKPAFADCTNPDVVRALVELCLEAGAKEVRVMDNPAMLPNSHTNLRESPKL